MCELNLLGICLPAIDEALLPECPKEESPCGTSSDLEEIGKADIIPPYHLFSMEMEDFEVLIRENQVLPEDLLMFIIVTVELGDCKRVCDKIVMSYLVKTFQYECLGYPLSVDFKGIFDDLRNDNITAAKLANEAAKRYCKLYLEQ